MAKNTICVFVLSRVVLFTTPWTVAHQVPLSLVFSRQEYWSGLPCPFPGDLPDPGIALKSPVAPALQADSLPTEPSGKQSFFKGNQINNLGITPAMNRYYS